MTGKENIIPIGSDHGGFVLKEYLVKNLKEMGYTIIDHGTFDMQSVDYSDFIHPVARSIETGEYEKGIIICGSGQGASMTANKYPQVRSGICWNVEQAQLTRQHNNANIIALPARFIDKEVALEAVKVFIKTEFEGGRHEGRVKKISQIIA